MKVAVLPYNALGDTSAALGRQLAAFAVEQLRANEEADVNFVQMLTQINAPDGPRVAYVNISDDLLNPEQIAQLFQQTEVDRAVDGSLQVHGETFTIVRRTHEKDGTQEIEEITFDLPGLFEFLHGSLKHLAKVSDTALPDHLAGGSMEFGTDNPAVFVQFLEGYDSVNYIQQAQGRPILEFSPQPSLDALLKAIEADPDFEGAYQVLVMLCRLCAGNRIGTADMLESALKRAIELVPEDANAYFALGELYEAIGQAPRACDFFEKAATLNPEDPALWTRLGIAQMNAGMPVNAERNFRKALELEGPDKPSAQWLAQVLFATGRGHEVAEMWRGILEANPEHALAHAQYAMTLIQDGKIEEGEKAFERGLETVEDSTIIKRFYAPYLGEKGDLDRAMDFFEDCIDEAPADVDLRLQYCQVLQKAGREFEVPNNLKDVLNMNPHPNVRAQTMAWLIELEQGKRVATVEKARERMEAGDFAGAVRDLRPMRNWLADYWKMWALLAAALNREGEYAEAEEACRRLVEIFPGCDPAYGELVTAMHGQHKSAEAFEIMRMVQSQNPQSLPMAINLMRAAHYAGQSEVSSQLARQLREALGNENQDLNAVFAELGL